MRETPSEKEFGARCRIFLFGSLLVPLILGACHESESASPLAPDEAATSQRGTPGDDANGWDLPLRSPGMLARAIPGRPCNAAPHRQFDFWVGEWNVSATATGAHIGTNVVTSELDGCVVQEHWTASNGNRGRSLNAYDPETGRWHQDWVSQVPQAFTGRLRTSGGLEDGTMVLTGERDGVSAGTEFTWNDEWTWTETPDGDVVQTGFALAGDPFDLVLVDFSGTYQRGDAVPADERITDFCRAGSIAGVTRDADFLVGEWDVSGRTGPALGTSTVETDLRACVFVERFESRGGLRSIAFIYWDFWAKDWYRVYVDSEGERLALRGGFEGSSLVLQGTEASTAGEVEVRVSWTPDGSDVLQTWQVSRDGRGTWKETAELVYTPR